MVSSMGICGLANAQTQKSDLFHDAEGNTYHQIFLDFQIKEVIKMHYSDDETPVQGELSEDGFSILIKNYPGEKSVKMNVIDMAGVEREISKSRCFIDPVLLSL